MKYKISVPDAVSHFLEIELHVEHLSSDDVTVCLPAWRPGRYELGNFSRNIQRWGAYDARGKALPFRKTDRNTWVVHTDQTDELFIRYNYYAAQLDAGSCRADEDQVYINPIHCCLYIPERMHEKCFVELDVPENYHTATALRILNPRLVRAEDYHHLVDSPIVSSPALQHNNYYVNDIMFHIWVQGHCKPDWARIIDDFSRFTTEQIRMFGSFPVGEYHFLVQALPYAFYHGVEHLHSTVLAIGPGSELMEEHLYTDFVGVASHELLHVWNVKTIRPDDLMPYDYSRENYSRLGFVYEGVTTYYGDLFLSRCNVYSAGQFFREIGARLQKHMDHHGRKHMSVADASFDTWVDGYVPGIPHRKTSIYDEGCLAALMTDLLIRRTTANEKSLDDVLRMLYEDFGKQHIGYSEHDYLTLVNNVAGASLTDFFMDYIYGTEPFLPQLHELLGAAGCIIAVTPSPSFCERHFGFRFTDTQPPRVSAVLPGSPARAAGIGLDDEIHAVNGWKAEGHLDELFANYAGENITVTVITPMKKQKDCILYPGEETFYPKYVIRKTEAATADQKAFFKAWLNQDF